MPDATVMGKLTEELLLLTSLSVRPGLFHAASFLLTLIVTVFPVLVAEDTALNANSAAIRTTIETMKESFLCFLFMVIAPF